jgi:hypothetical protein
MGARTDYLALFPVNGKEFSVGDRTWAAKIINKPDGSQGDGICYHVEFCPVGIVSNIRELRLWTSERGLHSDPRYREQLFEIISGWLGNDQITGEIRYFGK